VRRTLVGVLGSLLLAYAGLLAVLYLMQRSLLYFPQFTHDPPVAADFRLDVDGAVLRGWVVNPGQPLALLYFGGNGEDVSLNRYDVGHWAPGHTVYLVAYRGFGHSSGEPTEVALAADAIALFDHVAAKHSGIDALGRSVGSAVAVHLAAARPVRRLALITPFDSVLRVGQDHYPWLPLSWLLEDRFESWRRAPMLTLPILVVSAGRDNIIAPERTEALVAALPRPPERLHLPAAGHNDVQVFPEYTETLRRFFAAE